MRPGHKAAPGLDSKTQGMIVKLLREWDARNPERKAKKPSARGAAKPQRD